MYANVISLAVVYEVVKDRLRLENLNDRLNMAIETYVPDDEDTAPCTGTILCERSGVRHKAGCLGKVEPIDTFWKKVQRA